MAQAASAEGPVSEAARAFNEAYADGDALSGMSAAYTHISVSFFGSHAAEHPYTDLRVYLDTHPEAREQPLTELLAALPPVKTPAPCNPRLW